jgi:hypothetical protein
MIAVAEAQKPDVFVSMFVSNLLNVNIEKHLQLISEAYPDARLLVGGLQFKQNEIKIPPRAAIISDVQVFREELNKIETT